MLRLNLFLLAKRKPTVITKYFESCVTAPTYEVVTAWRAKSCLRCYRWQLRLVLSSGRGYSGGGQDVAGLWGSLHFVYFVDTRTSLPKWDKTLPKGVNSEQGCSHTKLLIVGNATVKANLFHFPDCSTQQHYTRSLQNSRSYTSTSGISCIVARFLNSNII